ncbi:MAG: DUF4834 domain-containing protein [Bacteroidetes bacterium]|nr:MAG: DUF4834 domain-containing protein [Bacteroidota bacterium]
MESFLNFILILVLIWLGFSLFFRYVFPRLLLYWVKRKQKKMMEQMGINPDDLNKKPHKEGEVSIDKTPGKDKKGSTENLGEYVDFEEID